MNSLLAASLVILSIQWTPLQAGVDARTTTSAAQAPTWPSVSLVDLDGRSVNPFADSTNRAIVFLFISVDCPISNSYAPEVRRLHAEFAPKNVIFKLIYTDPDLAPDEIRKHLKEYDYPCGALRDPKHELVRLAKARVTPEVAIFAPQSGLVYRGRIDDRFVDFGKKRPNPTVRDLKNALQAVLAGKPVAPSATRAIGCYIPAL